jgi:hypothetical protein
MPFLQTFGLPVQEPPAVHETQAPEALQTMLLPQLVPGALLPPSMQVWLPEAQEVVPFLQTLGLPVQEPPAVQETHVPLPLQTKLVPQLVPAALLPPSMQVIAPVEHEVAPFLQLPGLPVQACPAVHETQAPEPLQTMLVPQPVPAGLLPPSTQVIAPVEQEVVPFMQLPGLPVQACPAVHETQAPELLQTMLVPQLVPDAFGVPLAQIAVPVEHDATPFAHGFGLPEQLCPSVQVPQKPLPSQTLFVAQVVPDMMLPVPSTQTGAPVAHEMTPLLHGDGFPPHAVPAAHGTQVPAPLQTRLLPQGAPGDLAVPSMQVWTPVAHDVMPLVHAAPGFVVHA